MKRGILLRRWAGPLAVCAVFAAAFGGSYWGAVPGQELSIGWLRPQPSGYQPAMAAPAGAELVMIYIGASTCRSSNRPGLPGAVEQLKLRLAERARSGGRSFTTLGIARDWDTQAGIRHLGRFGRWDEVIAGRNWVNTGLLRYMWEDLPGSAETPQVVIVDRRLVSRRSPEAADGLVRDERVVARKIGDVEIERWLAQGAPIPALPRLAPAGGGGGAARPATR
jgi:hypothetical protein